MVLVGAGALAVGLSGTVSAGAGRPAHRLRPLPDLSPADASVSGSVAGFYSVPAIGFASASATLVVPKVTCTSKTSDAGQFFGLFDTNPTGTTGGAPVSAVSVLCGSSGPTYGFFTFVAGKELMPTGVKPGTPSSFPSPRPHRTKRPRSPI